MNMIALTTYDGDTVYVNADLIFCISPCDEGSMIWSSDNGNRVIVTQTPDEVATAIYMNKVNM